MIRMFGELIGDVNPRHMTAHHGEPPVVHGLYLASTVSMFTSDLDILGRRFTMDFLSPAHAGDDIEVTVTVTDVRNAGPIGDVINAQMHYRNQDAVLLAQGEFTAVVRPFPNGQRREQP
ncbi:hotdog domain-containing protein [Streptomyces sp. NPDC007205]|uniref:hotdog domain-containing protein n=1 Tax=Streptomyces sp. NPDC007205 TaxID=3154316 RepID=UPI0033E9CE9B